MRTNVRIIICSLYRTNYFYVNISVYILAVYICVTFTSALELFLLLKCSFRNHISVWVVKNRSSLYPWVDVPFCALEYFNLDAEAC